MSDVLGTALPVVLGGCFLAASGYVLQKKSHVLNEIAVLSGGVAKRFYLSPLWIGGMICMIVSAGLVVASAPFLDQSKQAPLGAATLVFNSLLLRLF